MKTTRSILSNPSSISAGRRNRGQEWSRSKSKSKSGEDATQRDEMLIQDEEKQPQRRVQFVDMYDSKSIKDIQYERLSREFKLKGHIKQKTHSRSSSPFNSLE